MIELRQIRRKVVVYISLMIIIFLLIGSSLYKRANAASDVDIDEGKIVITITSGTATTDTRFRTLGFYVTATEQTNLVPGRDKYGNTKKYSDGRTIMGPDVLIGPSKRLTLADGTKSSKTDSTTGITTTTYTYDEEMVKDLMRDIIDLDRLDKFTDQTPIFFNAVIQTYTIVNGKEVIINPEITTWADVIKDQDWGDRDFLEYFNIRAPFNAGLQESKLYYDIGGPEPIPRGALNSLKIGSELCWNSSVTDPALINIDGENVLCNLKGYYIKSAIDEEEIPGSRKMVGDIVNYEPLTAERIINNCSATVLYGGLNVYMIYEPSSIKVVIDARDIDTDKDIKSDLYIGTKNPKEVFRESIDNIINVDGIAYTKTEHFYYHYSYSDKYTRIIRDKSEKPEDPITFKFPDDIKIPSKLTVKAYYKKMVDGSIPVTVNAINSDTGAVLGALATGTVLAGKEYKYTISNLPFTSGGKSYDFTGEWKWSYKKNISGFPTLVTTGSGTQVSFKAPSADEIEGEITVNVYYKVKDTPATELSLRVIMVSRGGSFIEEISREKITIGQAISKSIKSSRSVNGLSYKYIDKWDYTYNTTSGDKTTTGSGSTAAFTVPSATRLGTVITLKLYYDADQEVEVPIAYPDISMSIDTPSPYAKIDGDKYHANYFNSKNGISTTESQYVYVKTKDYLLGYKLVNRTGKVTFLVPVTMKYTLNYFTATPVGVNGGPKPVTEIVPQTEHIPVERAYSYWEIESLEYFITNSSIINNYSLPNGSVRLYADGAYLSTPSLMTWHSSSKEDHYVLPKEHFEGIELEWDIPFTSDNDDRPQVEYQDLTAYATNMTGQLGVKNDYLVFDGVTVLSSASYEKIAGYPNISPLVQSNKIIHDKVLYTEGEVVDALKRNGVYQSNGVVTYTKHPLSVNVYQDNKTFNMPVNDVIIHTPVICNPILNSNNDEYVQLINPTEGAYHMVLDPDNSLNDFTIRISNTLPHSARLGYYERDFSRSFIDSDNISYIAKREGVVRNEMKLPFDVYADVLNDNNPENDEFIRAGTWIVLGRETHRFYVPMWVLEGTYTAQFRSIAVNGEDRIDNTETTRNSNLNNYVATSTKTIQISGRMYGLTLYDISDDGRWKDVFRIKDTMMFKYFEGAVDGTKRANYHADYAYYYTVGINNQYGYQNGRSPKYTFPLLNGSHPQYKNLGVTKTGYAIRFRLDTIGEMYGSGCKIRIVPTFYHVDEKGKNRQLVDIYYDEEFYNKSHYVVKVGEGIDLANLQQGLVGNPYSRIPEAELRHTARVMETTYVKQKNQYGPMYSYSDIRITSQFRTFIGLDYASHIVGLPSFTKVRNQIKESELNLSKYMQRWYGTYKLPMNIHVAPSGYDVKDHLKKYGIDYHEDFWLKDGYIIVNFNIESYDKDGNRNLSYTNGYNYLNNGHCSMWVMEGAATEKKDNTGASFRLYAGDVCFYYTSKKYSDDYMGRLY